MWRCWTPDQLPLLKSDLAKVLFLSAPSTGKTTLMEAKAFQCLEKGMDVLFLLPFGIANQVKSLLTLKMEQKWKDLKAKHLWKSNFHICSVKRNTTYNSILADYDHMKELTQTEAFVNAAIFIDELNIMGNDDLQALTEIVIMCCHRTIWLAITFINTRSVPMKTVKSVFDERNFHIPELVHPIRNSKGIVQFAYPSIKGKFVYIERTRRSPRNPWEP